MIFAIWDPALGESRDGAAFHDANTAKQAAILYLEADYRADPRTPENRALEVQRQADGFRWTVRLEPRVVMNWTGTQVPVPPVKVGQDDTVDEAGSVG